MSRKEEWVVQVKNRYSLETLYGQWGLHGTHEVRNGEFSM